MLVGSHDLGSLFAGVVVPGPPFRCDWPGCGCRVDDPSLVSIRVVLRAPGCDNVPDVVVLCRDHDAECVDRGYLVPWPGRVLGGCCDGSSKVC